MDVSEKDPVILFTKFLLEMGFTLRNHWYYFDEYDADDYYYISHENKQISLKLNLLEDILEYRRDIYNYFKGQDFIEEIEEKSTYDGSRTLKHKNPLIINAL